MKKLVITSIIAFGFIATIIPTQTAHAGLFSNIISGVIGNQIGKSTGRDEGRVTQKQDDQAFITNLQNQITTLQSQLKECTEKQTHNTKK